jgi:hypothetical protein
MKNYSKKLLLSIILIGCIAFAKAQETKSALDTLPANVEQLQSDMNMLNKLKITGFIQAQWQKADTIGSPAAFSGGNFSGTNNRFTVRRGRIKFAYTNDFSLYTLQFEVTEKGLSVKDAFVAFTDPWTKFFTITGGAFNRPFGYEIESSDVTRETPERARITQTLFNQERDLGAKLTLQAPKSSPWNFIKLDAGLFNGNALNPETDKYKDFIGHLYANKTFMNENLNIGLGVSYYNGGWASGTKYVYKMQGNGFTADSTSYKVGAKLTREYYGIEAQASINSVLGITTIRGEYLWGTQPGTKSTNVSPTSVWTKSPVTTYSYTYDSIGKITSTKATTTTPNDDAYIRNFSGGYVYFVQSIGQTKHELVVKYDWFDPNTKISSNQIGVAGTNTGAADIKYRTLGLGWNYHWNGNIRLTAYYELVKNETSNAPSMAFANNGTKTFAKNQKDNIFTLMLQYKF